MKTIITAALLAALAAQVAAADDLCAEIGQTAGMIMTARQNGATMSDMIGRVNAVTGASPEVVALTRAMIVDAYREPQWGTEGNKAQAISRFRNAVELTCYSAQ